MGSAFVVPVATPPMADARPRAAADGVDPGAPAFADTAFFDGVFFRFAPVFDAFFRDTFFAMAVVLTG
jgi:hypothetical protein